MDVVCGSEQALLAQAGGGLIMDAMQCRAARAMLQWKQADLALKAGVSVMTIRNFEAGHTEPMRATLVVLQQAFERAGVEFTDGDELGVKMRRKGKRK
jgi:transcriptional regulator with XRE-family HTH domain